MTPIDTSLNSGKGGGRQAAGHAGHVYSSANGLLNVSSHNSSKLSSSNSGSNVTKTTVDLSQLSHHELNSTQISPISARERELGPRRPLVDTSHASHATSHINGGPGLNLSRNTETLSRTEKRERTKNNVSNLMLLTTEAGVKEMIQSLGLLCLVSLLLALGRG